MADINLKDEKRISVNGEYDLVTTHPNNEPIYRSNGHELEFNASNSDFVSAQFSNTTITETSDIDLEFDFYIDSFDGGRIRFFHFSDENGETVSNNKAFWFETNSSRTDVFFRQSNSDGSVNANAFDLGTPIIGVNRVKILNGEAFLNGVKTSSDPNNYTLDIVNPYLKIARFFQSGLYTDLTLLNFIFEGETFNPTNITSNAQIEGSNGTIAQVNSSAADPINYILGTVFQKRGFALAFDAGNSEYVEFNPPINWSKFGDVDFDITFDLDLDNIVAFSRPFSYFIDNNNRLEIFFGSNGLLRILITVDGSTILDTVYTLNPLPKDNSFSIKDGIIVFNGVTYDESANINEVFVGSGNLFINYRDVFNPNAPFCNSTLKNLSVNSETFNLRRGLGVELIGSNGTTAEIKTSAANPQQRVNFGMWQKNGNALKLNASNSDYLEFDDFTFENGEVISVNVKDYNLTNIIYVFGNSLEGNTYLILSSSTVQIRKGSNITTFNHSETILNSLILSKNTNNLTVIINGNTLPSQSVSDDFVFNQFNERGVLGLKSTITLNSFELGSETFLFREGNGLTTTSESGNTTATINTSAANPTEYINTYVWNKDNNKFIDYKV